MLIYGVALDTLSVHPLEKIVTGSGSYKLSGLVWMTVLLNKLKYRLLLSSDLSVTGVRVNVYKRKKQNGEWVNQTVSNKTVKTISDAILQRARELYQEDNKN